MGSVTGIDELSGVAPAVPASAKAPALMPPSGATTNKKTDEAVIAANGTKEPLLGAGTEASGMPTAGKTAAPDLEFGRPVAAAGVATATATGVELSAAPAPTAQVAKPASPAHASAADAELTQRVGKKLNASEAVEIACVSERMIRQLSVHFSLAFRSFFWSLPVAVFAAGPIPFIVGTVFVTFFLLYMDTGGFGF
jgi:Protein of unknown function, DUF599